MKRIVLVEDSPVQTLVAKTVLGKESDLKLTAFSDGLEAYLDICANPPDLIIADIILPGLNGMALVRLVKFDQALKHIKVLMTSSITESDLEERVREIRADAFLRKPVANEDLLAEVKRLLS